MESVRNYMLTFLMLIVQFCFLLGVSGLGVESTKGNPVVWQYGVFDSNTNLRASFFFTVPGVQSHIMSQNYSTGKTNYLV